MSVLLKIDDLSESEVKMIIKELTIYPYNKYEETCKERGIYNPFPSKPIPPISMYSTNEKDRTIKVPYAFGCNLKGHKTNYKNPFKKIINDENFEITLREHQKKPFIKALDQLTTHNTTSLCLPPGFGKTVLGILLAYMKGYMLMIGVTRESIGDAWVKTIEDCLPTLSDKIWFVGKKGSKEPGIYFENIKVSELRNDFSKDFSADDPLSKFNKKHLKEYVPSFIICMDQRSEKICPITRSQVGTLIIDEAHLFCSREKVEFLLCLQPRYVILETATLQRVDKLEKMVTLIAGEHQVYKRSDSYYQVYKIDTFVMGDEEKGPRGVSYGKLCASLGENMYRNSIILDIVKTNPHRKYIILSISVPHVKLLQNLFKKNNIECDILCSNIKDYSDSHVLIGTMSKMGVGFDEKNACKDFKGITSDVLILCHSVAQWQLFEQYVGRVKRTEDPIVVCLNDKNKMVRNHITMNEDWIKLTNGKILPMKYVPGEIILPHKVKKAA